jgi:protein-disulfide isomerase
VSTGPTISRREGLVLAGLMGAAGTAILLARNSGPPWKQLPLTPTLKAAQAEAGPEAGNPNGDLLLLVFTDFNCPACRRAHPDMMAAVGADAGVRLRFLDWPVFGADSRAAARVALAADAQGLYLPVHTALMQGGRADAQAAEAALAGAGGDLSALRSTLEAQGPMIEGRLSRHAFHAFSLGLKGTPSHLVGRLLLEGAFSERTFRRAFSAARELSS